MLPLFHAFDFCSFETLLKIRLCSRLMYLTVEDILNKREEYAKKRVIGFRCKNCLRYFTESNGEQGPRGKYVFKNKSYLWQQDDEHRYDYGRCWACHENIFRLRAGLLINY